MDRKAFMVHKKSSSDNITNVSLRYAFNAKAEKFIRKLLRKYLIKDFETYISPSGLGGDVVYVGNNITNFSMRLDKLVNYYRVLVYLPDETGNAAITERVSGTLLKCVKFMVVKLLPYAI